MQLLDILKDAKQVLQENPKIVTGSLAVGGLVATAVSAAKVTPKAWDNLYDRGAYEMDLPTRIKTVWKCYIPTMVTIGGTVLLMLAGTTANRDRYVMLMALYAAYKKVYFEYEKAIVKPLQKIPRQEKTYLCFDRDYRIYFRATKKEIETLEDIHPYGFYVINQDFDGGQRGRIFYK